jgi:hypothetical protein
MLALQCVVRHDISVGEPSRIKKRIVQTWRPSFTKTSIIEWSTSTWSFSGLSSSAHFVSKEDENEG